MQSVSESTSGSGLPAGHRVLIVEDSMPLRRMLVKILATQQLEGIEAADGKEALTVLRDRGPADFCLILCDLMMPIMDGPSFLTEAKELYAEDLPPVVICSSRSDREAIQLVRQLGIAGYVLKPFTTDTIVNKLVEILSSRATE